MEPFTTATAAKLGYTRRDLQNAVAQGRLRRLLRGVYVRVEVPDSTALRARAAQSVTNPSSVLCDRTAAWIHGIDVLRYAELDTIPPIETSVLRGKPPTRRRECRGGTRDLRPEDWQLIDGVRVTTPLRTALDLACKLSRREAMAALDAFSKEFAEVNAAALAILLTRYFRRRGVVQARALVQLVNPASESAGESWTRLAIHDAGLPAPRLQHWVCIDGIPTYRLDLAYPHARVAVEYDGEEYHSDPEQREADARRRQWLREQGWSVIIVTKESFTRDALHGWLLDLRKALAMRGVPVH